jgi:asparagine synthase (glutamine-hydrolysing)
MCGICGVASRTGAPLRFARALPRMSETLAHRGPDGAGAVNVAGASLQVRRLSIVDLENGDQPFTSPDGRVSIVCNGEIYNSEELRRNPAAADYPFRSHSDVESVLPLYLAYGPAAIRMLEGMFGLAIWDGRTGTLLLARDRSGEKPLFWAEAGDEIVFGSEIKALLAYPGVDRALDPAALATYVAMGYVLQPRTMHRAIRKLPPGHVLTAGRSGVKLTPFWSAEDFAVRRDALRPADIAAAALEVRSTLAAAVQRELMADVPLGVFISGGIDSSLLLALAAPHFAPGRIFTYTAAFGDPTYDESGPASMVARGLRTTYRTVDCASASLAHALDAVSERIDEPLGDPAVLPTFLLAEAARGDVKVILSGEGADELFGGYPTYIGHRAARVFGRLPAPLRSGLSRAVFAWPPSPGKVTLEFLLKQFVSKAALPPLPRHLEWFGALGPAALEGALGPLGASGIDTARDDMQSRGQAALKGRVPLDGIMLFDMLTYLTDDLLTKVDRATMLSSVEARAPFLDRRVMEVALGIGAELKVKGTGTKAVLKLAARGLVPEPILNRRKRGLSVPIAAWINNGLSNEVNDLLAPGRLARQGWLNPAAVERLLLEHRTGHANHARRLWPLVMLQRWLDRWASPS